MILVRISGHSGAGKSRLLKALNKTNLNYHQHILYTSRDPLKNEMDGKDYFFRTRDEIEQLSRDRFLVGSVRQMLQAVDIDSLEQELLSNNLVIIELFHTLWPSVKNIIAQRLDGKPKIISIFLTALDPETLKNVDDQEAEKRIRKHVSDILTKRGRDSKNEIYLRTNSAVQEILGAIKNDIAYDKIIVSAPEGQDGKDDWTKEEYPINRAAQTLNEFLSIIQNKAENE